MLDADLVMLYGVEVRSLNQAVARNRKRFPADFMFQLSTEEYENIRSQFVTTSADRKVNSSQNGMRSQIVIPDKGDVRDASALRSQIVISKRRNTYYYLNRLGRIGGIRTM
jgi:ORF6N domain